MYALESFLETLRTQLEAGSTVESARQAVRSPYLEEHELAKVGSAVLAQRSGLPIPEVAFEPLSSGLIPLFSRGFFPWGAFPYPKEHAELATLLIELGHREVAQKMVPFQQATLDHHLQPIRSFFNQERGTPFSEMDEANRIFFQALELELSNHNTFVDAELGIVAHRTPNTTRLAFGSGCKSGMGVYLAGDAGLINYGLQLAPLGECGGFGLAGRGTGVTYTEEGESFSFASRCPLAAPHSRQTGFKFLQDSGYSGVWVESKVEGSPQGWELTSHLESLRSLKTVVFSLFGKGEACLVAGSHKLNPRSLDRYQGPPDILELCSQTGSVAIEPLEGFSHLEVIPLSGGEAFWGADFLIALSLEASTLKIKFS